MTQPPKARIAHVSGPTATIQNTPPLVTSNKARAKHGLAPRTNPDGSPARYDALRLQRLAAPARVYVEQFSAHPLERDAAHLYGPPDGWLDEAGTFSQVRRSDGDKPVYEIELHPDDGLYPLPYMALQADGSPWEEMCPAPFSVEQRQPFYPDGSRSFEEIDRSEITADGTVNAISALADVDFFRSLPPSGFTGGQSFAERTDCGAGDIAPERRGEHFFAYTPEHLYTTPARPAFAKAANDVQEIAASGLYDGIVWAQGSPDVEETAYWLNLLIDTTLPICCCAAQRPQGQASADGPQNLIDATTFVASRAWADADGRNRCGVVAVQEQQLFAAREVYKSDARPGNYRATGGHGGIIGQVNYEREVFLTYLPVFKHTFLSDVNITHLPERVSAATRGAAGLTTVEVEIKSSGRLHDDAIPSVSIIKDGAFSAENYREGPDDELELQAAIDHKLRLGRLAGFVSEGQVPWGCLGSIGKDDLLVRAVFSGLPVVRVARGAAEAFAVRSPYVIAGSNLTAIKARLLLMAALMKLGSLPIAEDPARPSDAEREATRKAVSAYQDIFAAH